MLAAKQHGRLMLMCHHFGYCQKLFSLVTKARYHSLVLSIRQNKNDDDDDNNNDKKDDRADKNQKRTR